MSTNNLKAKDIKRAWHLIDVKGQILGRISGEIATKLLGKNKPTFVPYLDTGDFVVVINAAEVKITGKKETDKTYFRHSGFPGGDKKEALGDLRKRRPEEVIRQAVAGMLPKTRLGKKMIKKLYVFAGSKHNYEKQLT